MYDLLDKVVDHALVEPDEISALRGPLALKRTLPLARTGAIASKAAVIVMPIIAANPLAPLTHLAVERRFTRRLGKSAGRARCAKLSIGS
jgi:hypothetical protein